MKVMLTHEECNDAAGEYVARKFKLEGQWEIRTQFRTVNGRSAILCDVEFTEVSETTSPKEEP